MDFCLQIILAFLSMCLSYPSSETHCSASPVSSPQNDLTNSTMPPFPGVNPLEKLDSAKFKLIYSNLWGSQHQFLSKDGSTVTLLLDRYSGGGFKSKRSYMYGFFNAAIKLQAGYTAGIITSFYLSNDQVYSGSHDEIDMELLGTIPGKSIVLQTNIYGNGTGDGIDKKGREQRFILWFDPTLSFHNYSILWSPHQIVFLVDDIPIRRIPRMKSLGVQYPSRSMSVYATIWDASDWATEGGKYRANYTYEPFQSGYSNFVAYGCENKKCSDGFLETLIPSKPKKEFNRSVMFVKEKYMVYDYCEDLKRYPKRLPECPPQNS